MVLGFLGLIQIVQMYFCGISLFTLFQLIPRIMFSLRMTGTVIKATTLSILEAVGLGVWIVWRALIMKTITLPSFLVYIFAVVICCVIYLVDENTAVYVVEDDE